LDVFFVVRRIDVNPTRATNEMGSSMRSKQVENHRRQPRMSASVLAVAVALALGVGTATTPLHAQATTGSIFGEAQPGEVVSVQSSSGINRQAVVDDGGHYTVGSLPLGDYTVTLQQDGKIMDTRPNIGIRLGSGTEVSFANASMQNAQNLTAVTVQANALPAIDVTGVDSRTVITSQELAKLPIARSAEAIALLAPGVVTGSNLLMSASGQNLVSFGGSSVTENAYYINGFNTTDPIRGLGGLTLPYGAIDQQEILTGGYDAAYGRSDGGVISQVGKRGTNEWHFGAQIQWTPTSLQSDPRNYHYLLNTPEAHDPTQSGAQGDIQHYRAHNKSWTTTVDAYAGGPLVKDKLFFFAAVEAERVEGHGGGDGLQGGVNSVDIGKLDGHERYDNPKWYGKLDWNITDSNILELTGISNKSSYQSTVNNWDPDTHQDTGFNSYDTSTKFGQDLYTGKFTSYITDNLSATVLYGKMKGTIYHVNPAYPGFDPTMPYVRDSKYQNPAYTGDEPRVGNQTQLYVYNPNNNTTNTNLRIDLSYKLGDHTITGGIDNQNVSDVDDGQQISGPGYAWDYGNQNGYIVGGPDTNGPNWQRLPWVAPSAGYPGGTGGYYVQKYVFSTAASVTTKQRAQYLEDSWQVNDRWLVKVGIRNDQFINNNGAGVPYLRLTSPQWAPRVGFSWDVNGDSSFKIYGNAGRYYLAMPASVALRSAGASTLTNEYYTYTGIDANGSPTGLTPIDTSAGPGAPISPDLEYGVLRDPQTAAARNLKSEYQDEYIFGFDKKLGDAWVYGAKATYRNLRNGIDDTCSSFAIADKMQRMGLIDANTAEIWGAGGGPIYGCYMINPGATNVIRVANPAGGYYDVPMEWSKDYGFNTSMKRKYYGLDLYLEHPFDGKWFGKIDYLYSKSYGNSEGQVRSDIGQQDVSATEDWDFAQIMDYANGDLANDRRHQIKAYGSYQLTPEWMLSGNVEIMSGSPKECLGYYQANQGDPLGYGDIYHWCDGTPFSPGGTHNPWTYTISLSAEYRPEWADKKLAFNVMVYNVLNQQRTLQTYPYYGSSAPDPDNGGAIDGLDKEYQVPINSQQPRYVRLGVSYDF
jgi:hypothetical protein